MLRVPLDGRAISTGSGYKYNHQQQLVSLEPGEKRTFGSRPDGTVLDDLVAVAQLADDAAVLLVHEHDPAALAGARAALHVALAGGVVGRVIRRQLLGGGRLPGLCAGPLRAGRRRALEEGGALRQDGLEGVDVLLHAGPGADGRELDAREGAAVGPEVPARDQVAGRRLVVDLRGGGQRQVELGRQVEVQVEVVLAGAAGAVGEARGRGHHEQRQRLRAVWRQRLLGPVGDVVGPDALDGVQQLRVLARVSGWPEGGAGPGTYIVSGSHAGDAWPVRDQLVM